MVETARLNGCFQLFHRVRHLGVVLGDGDRVESFVIEVMTQAGRAMRVNRAPTHRGDTVGLFGLFQDLAVIDLGAVCGL